MFQVQCLWSLGKSGWCGDIGLCQQSAHGNAKKCRLGSDESTPSGGQVKKNRGDGESSSSSSLTSSDLMAYIVQGDPVIPMTDPPIKKVEQRLSEKIISVGRKPHSAMDPLPKLPRFYQTVEVSGSQCCEAADKFLVEWLNQFTSSLKPLWHSCKFRVVDEYSLL